MRFTSLSATLERWRNCRCLAIFLTLFRRLVGPMVRDVSEETKRATRNSWTTEPMPRKVAVLSYTAEFSSEEFKKISRGLIPQMMEEKWFIYLYRKTLHRHRSWTGFCVYQVEFERPRTNTSFAVPWSTGTRRSIKRPTTPTTHSFFTFSSATCCSTRGLSTRSLSNHRMGHRRVSFSFTFPGPTSLRNPRIRCLPSLVSRDGSSEIERLLCASMRMSSSPLDSGCGCRSRVAHRATAERRRGRHGLA